MHREIRHLNPACRGKDKYKTLYTRSRSAAPAAGSGSGPRPGRLLLALLLEPILEECAVHFPAATDTPAGARQPSAGSARFSVLAGRSGPEG